MCEVSSFMYHYKLSVMNQIIIEPIYILLIYWIPMEDQSPVSCSLLRISCYIVIIIIIIIIIIIQFVTRQVPGASTDPEARINSCCVYTQFDAAAKLSVHQQRIKMVPAGCMTVPEFHCNCI